MVSSKDLSSIKKGFKESVIFQDRYEGILKERPDDWDDVAGKNCYIQARKVYYEYIEQQLQDVNGKLQLLVRWIST